jgi:putative ABC transport system permease protein
MRGASLLALRELAFARGRFALMGAVIALIAVLMVLLSGLSVGLVNDGVSGLQKLPVTSFAFQDGVKKDAAFSRSVVDTRAVRTWAARPGVADAAPFGNTLVNGRTDRAVSASAAEQGVELGDTVVLEPSGQHLTVVGILGDQHTYGHVDVAYLTLHSWRQAKAGLGDGEPVPPRVLHEATAVAVRAAPGADVDLAAGDAAAGTTSMTLEQSYGASPGYTAETSTLQLIQVFLYLISALVVGAFFTVLTIQRKGEIAVLRALGASTRYLLQDSLLQSVVLLVLSAAGGITAGVGLGAAIATTQIPFALEAGPIAGATALLLVLGLGGATVAVLRITRVDPLAALGGNR